MAHVDLAKAEASAIAGQVARLAALIGAAIALLIMMSIVLIVGTTLWLGEWLLGSIGWGVLLGVLAFTSIAMACVLAAVGVPGRRIAGSLAGAVVVGAVVAVLLAFDLPNRAYAALGDGSGLAIEAGVRPLVIGSLSGSVLGLLIGLLAAARSRASRSAGAVGGLVVGLVVGALSAIGYTPGAGVGVGITVGYVTWMVLLGLTLARDGVDTEALKARFTPTQTIETSKETLEWLQKRMPPGIG